MYVAMKDLEIRGAGNLLGGEQSGHIAGVGFDLYVRMVGEAVADFQGEGGRGGAAGGQDRAAGRRARPARLRHRASGCASRPTASWPPSRSEEDIEAVREELDDRYGEPPTPVENLLVVAGLRMLARGAGLDEVSLAGNNIRFAPVELPRVRAAAAQAALPGNAGQARSPYDPGTQAHDRPGGRAAAARRRAPALVPRPRPGRAAPRP